MEDPIKYLVYLLWALGTTVVYSLVLRNRRRSHELHHDPRSRREVVSAFGLWLVALASSVAILIVLVGPEGRGIRGLCIAIALGAFTGAGIVMATEKPTRDPAEAGAEVQGSPVRRTAR